MTELLPCPFCGGEAVFNTYRTTCSVDCPECRIGTYQVALDDYRSAIEAWNTRAERTCKNEYQKWPKGMYYFVCSECGWNLVNVGRASIEIAARLMRRCPGCGAKVVD